MCFISLNGEKIRHSFSVLFVRLPYSDTELYRAFSNMAVDHWCLSLSLYSTAMQNHSR